LVESIIANMAQISKKRKVKLGRNENV
jgi:hypothetical protein